MGDDKGSALGRVALETGCIPAFQLGAASFDRRSFVRIMAIAAGHLPGQNGVAVREHELGLLVHVALEAGPRIFVWVDDRAGGTTRLHVLAAWTVAGFAAHVRRVLAFGHQLGVVRRLEVPGDLVVTLVTTFGTKEGCSGNERRGHHRPASRGAGDQDEAHTGTSSRKPQNLPGQVAGPTAQSGPGGCSPQMFHEC